MCTTNIYVHVRPDGRRSTTPQVVLCPSSRFGRPCAAHVEVHHPMPQDMLLPTSASPITTHHFPPTPQYSPRPSSRDSGSDADRHSRHSSTSSSRRRQRSPGIYVNGQRVVHAAHGGSARHERVMLVPNPPTPRTPPQSFNMPRTAPPSPSANLSIPYGSSPRDHYNRPYLVDERRVHAPAQYYNHPASPASSSRHSRQASTSSQGSRHSASAAAAAVGEEERRRRRDEEREQRRVARKAQELRERIEKANAEIASRPTVRVVNEQPKEKQQLPTEKMEQEPRRSRRDGFDEVVGAMGRMTVEDRNWKERRAHERALELEKEEQKAQDQRLGERMVPRRRATVGPGSRRHRVAYDDGLYRWE